MTKMSQELRQQKAISQPSLPASVLEIYFYCGASANVPVIVMHMLMRLLLLMASQGRGSLGLTCQHLQRLLLQTLLCNRML